MAPAVRQALIPAGCERNVRCDAVIPAPPCDLQQEGVHLMPEPNRRVWGTNNNRSGVQKLSDAANAFEVTEVHLYGFIPGSSKLPRSSLRISSVSFCI